MLQMLIVSQTPRNITLYTSARNVYFSHTSHSEPIYGTYLMSLAAAKNPAVIAGSLALRN